MAAPEKTQAEKPMSPPREHGLPLESESMRILQQAVAAAEQAMTGAEQITARASRLESAIGAVARNCQALIATRERAVAEAQEQASHAIAAAEASLGRIGQPTMPAATAPMRVSPDTSGEAKPTSPEQATAQEQADRASAVAEEAVSAITRSTAAAIAAFDQLDVGDAAVAQQAMQQAAAAQAQSIDVTRQQAGAAIAAAVAGTSPPTLSAKSP